MWPRLPLRRSSPGPSHPAPTWAAGRRRRRPPRQGPQMVRALLLAALAAGAAARPDLLHGKARG
eukprot:7244413-Pyramimonas_sp.AAC.1